ncbi:MAG: hypothetical protein JWM95_2107 [Gemmatimonadetes bacterium]|nr:hypothetical protein [Gemmatimonadota bacterium]
MPGYGAVPDMLTGVAADIAREASLLEQEGDRAEAVRLYERAIVESLQHRPQLPGFVCGRLAQMYRHMGLYQLEVELLERYRDSQTDDAARTRFDARLSKARTLAVRYRSFECGALSSVRAIKPARQKAKAERNLGTDAA